jgi:hypothetical protein
VLGLRGSRVLSVAANLVARGTLAYLSLDALRVTSSNPSDARYAGKGIAVRNAAVLASFSALLPTLYVTSHRERDYPWTGDTLLLTVPLLDMAGNWLDLYNRYGFFDTVAHFYGPAVVSGLVSLALAGRDREPRVMQWAMAAGVTTTFHLLLEVQEYWTDVWFGTHNVEGIEDVEGDLGAGVLGTAFGTVLAGLLFLRSGRRAVREEASRLGTLLDPLFADKSGSKQTSPVPSS